MRAFNTIEIESYPLEHLATALEGTEFLPISAQKAFEGNNYSKGLNKFFHRKGLNFSFSIDIDLMAGVTRNEGSLLARLVEPKLPFNNITENDFEIFVNISNQLLHELDMNRIKDYYLKNIDKNNSNELMQAIYEFNGNLLVKCPTYLFAKHFAQKSNKNNVYFYELTYQSQITRTYFCDEMTMGICHFSDVEFVFGTPILYMNLYMKKDIDFSKDVMKMWTNFAKYG